MLGFTLLIWNVKLFIRAQTLLHFILVKFLATSNNLTVTRYTELYNFMKYDKSQMNIGKKYLSIIFCFREM
jgi:hypothetical protein